VSSDRLPHGVNDADIDALEGPESFLRECDFCTKEAVPCIYVEGDDDGVEPWDYAEDALSCEACGEYGCEPCLPKDPETGERMCPFCLRAAAEAQEPVR
jgi:hypothetical protein